MCALHSYSKCGRSRLRPHPPLHHLSRRNGNSLTGSLPASLPAWPNMTWFSLNNNKLGGSVPATLNLPPRLLYFGVK